MGLMVRFLVVSLILLLPAAWGRSPFMSAFKPYLKAHVPLSETWLSFSFTVGNLLAAALVPVFICLLGENFSLTKAFRRVYIIFIFGFLSFFGAMKCDDVPTIVFLFLVLGYCGLRGCGQGLLPTLVSCYGSALYDDKKCAWFASWHSLVQVIGSVVLYILSAYNAFNRWHWVLIGQIGILLLYVLFTPRRLLHISSVDIQSPRAFSFMFKQFPPIFIIGMYLIALESFHATGIMFHISNFAREQSVPLEKIFKAFLPLTILTLIFTPLVSKLYTYVRLHIMLFLLVLSLIFANLFLLKLSNEISIWLFVVFNALAWGFNHVLSYALVSRVLPGTQRAIGYSTLIGFSSLCSAVGPFIYSCLFAFFGSYTTVGRVMFGINILIALWILYLCRYTEWFQAEHRRS